MPLDRAHVTAASRIMLPAYVVFFAWVGGNWLLTPEGRLLLSPGLAYADDLLTIRAWGALFVSAALVMVVAMIRHSRDTFRFALAFCTLTLLVWAGVTIASGIFGDASPSAPAWPLFVATACYASNKSLTVGER